MFHTIAIAAWECADPGIQYDGTINDWHTNPETGRITASNPAPEDMSLDNSSCNLASLNLMKFLKDDDTFDAVTFAKAVEVIITAMDISICFADFPNEAMARPTRDYRQLVSATPTLAHCRRPAVWATSPTVVVRWPPRSAAS